MNPGERKAWYCSIHTVMTSALHQQCYLSKTGCERGEGCLLSFPVSRDISHGKVWLRSRRRGSLLSFKIANQSPDQVLLLTRLHRGVPWTCRAIYGGFGPCRWGRLSGLTLLITQWGIGWGGGSEKEREREGKSLKQWLLRGQTGKEKNAHSSLLSWAFPNDNNLSSSYF